MLLLRGNMNTEDGQKKREGERKSETEKRNEKCTLRENRVKMFCFVFILFVGGASADI